MAYSAAIVGLGNIGFLYDRHLPQATHALTHARAFDQHPDFHLVAAIEPMSVLRREFERVFDVPAYESIADIPAEVRPDVVVVASPTETHVGVVDQLMERHPLQAILCEKPLAYRIDVARSMEEKCRSAGVPLYANFIRRADPGVLEVRSRLDSGRIAMPFKAVAWYSKGLLHNGAHFADLLSFWFGPILAMTTVASGRRFGEQDAEPDLRFEFASGSALLCAAREEDYSHYTLEVIAANGRLRYEQGGDISWQPAVTHPVLPGYRRLDATPEPIHNDMNRYQYRIAEQLSLALQGHKHSLCTGAWSIACQEWLTKAIADQTQGD
jgi:predicted dehydrogenase